MTWSLYISFIFIAYILQMVVRLAEDRGTVPQGILDMLSGEALTNEPAKEFLH